MLRARAQACLCVCRDFRPAEGPGCSGVVPSVLRTLGPGLATLPRRMQRAWPSCSAYARMPGPAQHPASRSRRALLARARICACRRLPTALLGRAGAPGGAARRAGRAPAAAHDPRSGLGCGRRGGRLRRRRRQPGGAGGPGRSGGCQAPGQARPARRARPWQCAAISAYVELGQICGGTRMPPEGLGWACTTLTHDLSA